MLSGRQKQGQDTEMATRPTDPEQTLAGLVIAAFEDQDVAALADRFTAALGFREFASDRSLAVRVALNDAVRSYLASGDALLAENAAADGTDRVERLAELTYAVNESESLDEIAALVHARVTAGRPDLASDRSQAVVGRTVLDLLVDRARAADRSVPLDIAENHQVTVCYIPGSGGRRHYSDVATTSWAKRSDSMSIYPDRTFLDFLRVVGIGKQEWLSAAEGRLSPKASAKALAALPDRAAVWEAVPEWECRGALDVETDDVVSAVDACPYGFTPMIAFQMDARDVFELDFESGLEVTGGIVGLHDFTNGTGDPLRFEGTLRLSPRIGDLHLADDEPLGLVAIHGFLSDSFRSAVRQVAPENGASPQASPGPR